MSIGQLIQLALLFMKLANWITRKVDQASWERSGYKKAMGDELVAIGISVGLANQALKDAKALTPEEKRRRLEDPI